MGGRFPLSFSQKRLWFFEQLHPDSATYNVPAGFEIKGPLQIESLRWAILEITRRHASLRTSFRAVQGIPYQDISDDNAIELSVQQIPDWPYETLIEHLTEEVRKPFDLSTPPLMRVHVYQRDDQHSYLLIVMHHIISDGWSMGVFYRELGLLYKSHLKNIPSLLSELPQQYVDYAKWQEDRFQGTLLENHLSYWKKQIDNPPVLDLPADKPRPRMLSYRGAAISRILQEPLHSQLTRLSNQNHVTLFMSLVAAVNILLMRYTGQKNILIGTPFAGRNSQASEDLIGFFVNTLLIRTELEGDPTFLELLRRVRQTTLEAYEHQELPFEMLVEELQPERSLSHTPLFQVLMALQNSPKSPFDLIGLNITQLPWLDTGTAKFDWSISFSATDSGLRMRVDYSLDLFEEPTILRMMDHFENLLRGIIANPEERISRLPLLGPKEREQVIVGWNQTKTDYPFECIHQLFEKQARKSPSEIAIEFGESRLTYQDLNRQANALAHLLMHAGAGRGTVVGICMDRTPELIVAFLGVLKSGGVYLPLDPEYPKSRIGLLLQQAGTKLVVTTRALESKLPESVERIFLENQGTDECVPTGNFDAEDLAYIIHTSGSSGEPKGVAVPHRAVVRLVCNTNYIQIGSSDRIAQASHSSFDAATFEIWGALLNGARLVILPKHTILSPGELGQAIREKQITALFLPTALFHIIAQENSQCLQPLQTLLVGGEAMNPTVARQFLEEGPPARFMNVYGPTETTTFASWHLIREVPNHANSIPIGRPISNTALYVLDANLHPVPIGVAGEIYIGGAGVAKGYVNLPELTNQSFLPDPFSQEAGALLYRTGDLGRLQSDGSIEFLGRNDEQIKIRGFRIEPAEIERTLALVPEIKECAVIPKEIANQMTLVAFLAPKTAHSIPDSGTLRSFLKEKLPDFMVPAHFVVLNALPRTEHNKVDRQALQEISIATQSTKNMIPPGDSYEARLALIWKSVLGVESVGAEDNFFEMGGHSLMAVRLFSQIKIEFGKILPLTVLFEHPTVGELARYIRKTDVYESTGLIRPVQPKGSKPPFFFLWGIDVVNLVPHLGTDQPLYCIEIDGKHPRMGSLASDCVREIRNIQPHGPYFVGGFCLWSHLVLEIALQLHSLGQPLGAVILVDPPGAHSYQQTQSMRVALKRVWKHFKEQKSIARFGYLYAKIRNLKVGRWKTIFRFQMHKFVGTSPPEPLLQDGWNYYQQLARDYRPRLFPGTLTIISREEAEGPPRFDWQQVASSLQVHSISGIPAHDKMLMEPYVSLVAAKLSECLARKGEDEGAIQ